MAEPASEPVPDPSPELRERIEALRLSLSPGVTKPMPENGVWCQGYNQALDDVLSALGEKK